MTDSPVDHRSESEMPTVGQRFALALSLLHPEAGDLDTIGRAIAAALDGTLERRQSQLIARCVVAIELPTDSPLRVALATSLFSRSKAAELFRAVGASEPDMTAVDFVSLCEGGAQFGDALVERLCDVGIVARQLGRQQGGLFVQVGEEAGV